jgi:general secretion pathway protein D
VTKVPFNLAPEDGGPPTETGSAFTFMNLSPHFDLTAVVEALQTANDARLVANPHVAVLENEEAIFQSVSEIPYQQLTQTQQGGQIGTTAFKEAGITLRVRPKVSSDGTIEMLVSPEFSRLTGFTPVESQPIIDRRTATTTLSVANRQTVVIGGLRERRDVGDFKGVPYLKDVRYVGRLFRSRNTDVRESELVVFIMPEIIGPADPMDRRERLIADTTHYRLDQIPEAEGHPPGYIPDHCRIEQTPLPSQENPVERMPQPAENKEASAALQFPQDLAANESPAPALVAQQRPRRLPPVGQSEEVVSVAAKPPTAGTEPADKARLRPDFDSRFRATGGVNPHQQRTTENGLPDPPEEEEQSFWRRYLPF